MRHVIISLLMGLLLLSSTSLAAQGLVITSDNCDYQLLAMADGSMTVIKTVEGTRPQKNDIIVGDFPSQSFSKVINQRTKQVLNIWVDQADDSSSQALSQYSSYCNK